jgi:rhamnogalacturonan acetylesterase
MNFKRYLSAFLLVFLSVLLLSFNSTDDKPTLYLIGDSTVKNGSGEGSDSLWGWGSFIDTYFDSAKINIENHAIGGRSSRTFLTDGRWDKILATLKKGDYVMIQFGHNDGGALDDTERARGTIPGTGPDSTKIYNPIRKVDEVVHTYGWYLRKYANEAKAKSATVIICSPIPRNDFEADGTIKKDKYAAWAKEAAAQTGANFIPLNDLVIAEYQKLGAATVKAYFPKEHTHTNKEGAELNAKIIANFIKDKNTGKLKKYLIN